jgi:sialic acid synthase SpsE
MKTTLSSSKFIAEVCSNHNGNLKRALKFVDFAKNS